ncbi:hypothetical protein GCM10011376_25960 [Nocardioides flavus (ex Wang et al. 2016)]|uniref:Uncharacterized protein n=1 Tax=Nocardioides flavus (ex Wang et al. 2016) TaxID=2058780 RepID=A0ABQ3HMM9_9ACTN|nr:hypothetical protein GCM10011376_25960 [Nocardioides flavus (ex Wang et al. 2016)]
MIAREHKVRVVDCLAENLQSASFERGIFRSGTGLDLEDKVGVDARVQLAWSADGLQLLTQMRTVRAALSAR